MQLLRSQLVNATIIDLDLKIDVCSIPFAFPANSSVGALREPLQRVDQNPAMLNEPEVENNLTHELSKHLARHMPRAAEMSEEIQEMSIDSLMAVEI
ncbi:polyketide synthase [Aspergillus luchuensis]|uniref:Polyketide synthase n=1 Tax=Aspergillus kawachii TaxID=1069201 RepID=A0A146FPS4_ASPKA|nr:polyketide synthase [Aspergillus luchuensis]